VAIETPRGLLVACLRAGRAVYPVNPMAVARYRDRHSVAGRKSDKGDAAVLANVLRTDMHAHRPLPADSHGPSGPGAAPPARRRLPERRRPRGRHRVFSQHPDAGIITSFPGIGALTGCSPRSEMTGPASPMVKGSRPTPGPLPSRARGQVKIRHPPPRQEQPSRSSRLHLGVLRPDRITRRPRLQRPPPRRR
jgi:Transposase